MLKLRSYQIDPIEKAVEFFNTPNAEPSLIVLPTAWGKSLLAASVARRCEGNILVVQPSKELLEQNLAKYETLCGGFGLDAGVYSASFGKKEINRVTFATIGSIKEKGELFREYGFSMMLIDEAHLYPRVQDSMLGQFLADSGITHVLGITATPIRLYSYLDRFGDNCSKIQMLTEHSIEGDFYKDILHVGQIREMVDGHWWSPLEYKEGQFNGAALQMNFNRSEFTEKSINAAYNDNGVGDSIIRFLAANPRLKHILVYVPSVEAATKLSWVCKGSAVVSGDMPKKERAAAVKAFREGKTRVMFNVKVFAVGFDFTGVDCIVLGISTSSVALYYQIVGRGTRIDPQKKSCCIVDFGGNVARFGRVEDMTFEKGEEDGKWRLFGTDDVLLSGVPIHEIGRVRKKDIAVKEKYAALQFCDMPFGKYKGINLADVPASYRGWLIDNFSWTENNKDLRTAVLWSLRKDDMDEKVSIRMPFGKYKNEPVEQLPKVYCQWLLDKYGWSRSTAPLKNAVEQRLAMAE